MLRKILHHTALKLEYLFERVFHRQGKTRVIDPYVGYATPAQIILRGRVLTALRGREAVAGQSRWVNFKQMAGLFLTDEVGGVTVSARGVAAVTDEEGYFHLHLPRTTAPGWAQIPVAIVGQADATLCPVLVPGPTAQCAVISDIDDTVLQTGAYSLLRNLWTSLTGNVLTRHIFEDAVTFMRTLSEDGRNPVFYVSSSPWNLHSFLTQIFKAAGLVPGPMFLRDLGLGKDQFITGTHGDHKGGSIDKIMAANPDLPVILVGDTGQHDTFVYRDAIQRHPGRVAAVILREPGPGPDAKSRAAMAEIEASGVALLHGPDFKGFSAELMDPDPKPHIDQAGGQVFGLSNCLSCAVRDR